MNASHTLERTHSHMLACVRSCDFLVYCGLVWYSVCVRVCSLTRAGTHHVCCCVGLFSRVFFCGVVCGVLLLFSVLVKTYAIQCMHTNTHAHTARTAAMHIAQQVVHPRPSVGAGRPAGLPQRIHSHTRTDAYNQPVRRESRSCQRSRASRNRHSHTHTKSLL